MIIKKESNLTQLRIVTLFAQSMAKQYFPVISMPESVCLINIQLQLISEHNFIK